MNKVALKNFKTRTDKYLVSNTKKLIPKLLEINSVKLLREKRRRNGISSRKCTTNTPTNIDVALQKTRTLGQNFLFFSKP